jgi:putative ABC transport system permease protein
VAEALRLRRAGRRPGIRLGADDYQIVGVAPQGFHFPPDAPTELILPPTMPLQAPARRITGDPARALPGIQAAVRAIEPNAVFIEPRTLAEIARESMQVIRLALWLFGIFAAIALALAAVGIYGLMSYLIRQRTREIGTRVALGATHGDILWLVMRLGAMIAAGGTAIGLAAGVAAARSLGALLYGTSIADPVTLAGASATLVATIMLACYVPARRAALIDPARTLADT